MSWAAAIGQPDMVTHCISSDKIGDVLIALYEYTYWMGSVKQTKHVCHVRCSDLWSNTLVLCWMRRGGGLVVVMMIREWSNTEYNWATAAGWGYRSSGSHWTKSTTSFVGPLLDDKICYTHTRTHCTWARTHIPWRVWKQRSRNHSTNNKFAIAICICFVGKLINCHFLAQFANATSREYAHHEYLWWCTVVDNPLRTHTLFYHIYFITFFILLTTFFKY